MGILLTGTMAEVTDNIKPTTKKKKTLVAKIHTNQFLEERKQVKNIKVIIEKKKV